MDERDDGPAPVTCSGTFALPPMGVLFGENGDDDGEQPAR